METHCFVGKGGVGKTTLAVALAEVLHDQGCRVALVGLDQQHNHDDLARRLGLDVDVFKVTNDVSDRVYSVIENSMLSKFKEYAPLVAPDFVVICSLGELLSRVGDSYTHLVVDVPPNTSAFYMLDMPNIMDMFVFKALTLKNRVRRLVKGSDEVLDNIEYFRDLILGMKGVLQAASWHAVSIPTWLGVLETRKIVSRLEDLSLVPASIVVNMINMGGALDCLHCDEQMRLHAKYLPELRKVAAMMNVPIVEIPWTLDRALITSRIEGIYRRANLSPCRDP